MKKAGCLNFLAGYGLGFATLFVLILVFGDYDDENPAIAQTDSQADIQVVVATDTSTPEATSAANAFEEIVASQAEATFTPTVTPAPTYTVMPPATHTPEPTWTPAPTWTPEPTFTPSPSARPLLEWYEGGTLHQATVDEWRAGSERDRLATAADWVAAVWEPRPASLSELRFIAEQVVICVNEVALAPEANSLAGSQITDMASTCIVMMRG